MSRQNNGGVIFQTNLQQIQSSSIYEIFPRVSRLNSDFFSIEYAACSKRNCLISVEICSKFCDRSRPKTKFFLSVTSD